MVHSDAQATYSRAKQASISFFIKPKRDLTLKFDSHIYRTSRLGSLEARKLGG
jgi:hypothetical protein